MGNLSLLTPAAPPPPEARKETLLARLGLTPDRAVDPRQVIYTPASSWGRQAPGPSEDLERILALTRRPKPTQEQRLEMARVMTERLRWDNPACRCAELRPGFKQPCITSLNPIQGWFLTEAADGGALGHIAVGGGKTGLDVLLAMVVPGAKRVMLLLPPGLRDQFALDYLVWGQHFRVPNLAGNNGPWWADRPVLTVVAYTQLQTKKWSTMLAVEAPDTVIADEGHCLADKESVRTHRLLRHYADGGGFRYFVYSGALTTHSLDDYAHHSAMALRGGSPVPIDTKTVAEWAQVIDPWEGKRPPVPIGSLAKLCVYGETARAGFRRRLIETRGVVTTEDVDLPCRLALRERHVKVPAGIQSALDSIRESATRPDGEPLKEQSEVVAAARQVAAGFHYFWRYPRGESAELIDEWFNARKEWFRELREKLTVRYPLMDSPDLLTEAAERYWAAYKGPLPTWGAVNWKPWSAISPKVKPVQGHKWLDSFLVDDAVAWAREAPGIVWFSHRAFGRAVATAGRLPLYGEGKEASATIKNEDGSRSIVASIKAHGTGKNLQMFRRALITTPPANGGEWEQVLGRLHRQGQSADEVEFWVYRHAEELKSAIDDALADAHYVQETTGKVERLLFATRYF